MEGTYYSDFSKSGYYNFDQSTYLRYQSSIVYFMGVQLQMQLQNSKYR